VPRTPALFASQWLSRRQRSQKLAAAFLRGLALIPPPRFTLPLLRSSRDRQNVSSGRSGGIGDRPLRRREFRSHGRVSLRRARVPNKLGVLPELLVRPADVAGILAEVIYKLFARGVFDELLPLVTQLILMRRFDLRLNRFRDNLAFFIFLYKPLFRLPLRSFCTALRPRP